MRRRTLLGLLCLSIASVANATAERVGKMLAHIGRVVVEIPSGFSGPKREFPNAQSEIQNYFEVVGGGISPTVIQLTRVLIPHASSELSEQTRYLAACDFLNGFLEIFGQKVTKWSRSSNERFRFDGNLGARATWTGTLHGIPATGVMYLVVLGKDSYSFHVFGSSAKPNVSLKESIRAIENLRMKAPDKSQEYPREQ